VLVVPSRREALARVIMEAFAAGVPVVASASGGIPEIVRHEHNGLLVPAEDARALAAAVRRCLDDSALRSRLVTQGRRDYLSRFQIGDYRRTVLAVLRDTLNSFHDPRVAR
jgi:glycosyltransferase involved in cell wall biosynthesis